MPTVRQYMTRDPISVLMTSSVAACARLLLRHGVQQLPVVDSEGAVQGLVETVTLFRRGNLVGPDQDTWVAYDPDDQALLASDVMQPAEVVDADSDLLRTLAAMLENRLPVAIAVSEGGLCGILTEHDALSFATNMLPPALALDEQFSEPVQTVEAHVSVADVWTEMDGFGIRHVVVRGDDGGIEGVVSRRDLALAPRARTVLGARRSEATFTVHRNSSFAAASAIMLEKHIGCLPVVTTYGDLIGIITRRDVLRTLVFFLEGEVERLRSTPGFEPQS